MMVQKDFAPSKSHVNLVVSGIPFESESQLREKGSAKTPDAVL
jgi:hypothetical protein